MNIVQVSDSPSGSVVRKVNANAKLKVLIDFIALSQLPGTLHLPITIYLFTFLVNLPQPRQGVYIV